MDNADAPRAPKRNIHENDAAVSNGCSSDVKAQMICFRSNPNGNAVLAFAQRIRVSRVHTYRWLSSSVLPKAEMVEDRPVLGPAIKDAINRQLGECGFMEAVEPSDWQVSTAVFTGSVPQLESVVSGGRPDSIAAPAVIIRRYNRGGTLIANLMDAHTRESRQFRNSSGRSCWPLLRFS